MRNGSGRIIPAVVGGGLLALLALLAVAMTQGVGGLVEGRSDGAQQAPDFSLAQLDGPMFSLAQEPDRPVFLYFWASWCIPCEAEAPVIESLWPEYRDRGWAFLGVNIWDREADARAFVDRLGLSFPVARDEEGSVYLDYGVQALPTAFFITPGGRIHARYDGQLTEPTLRSLLDEVSASTGVK
ncbi:MAG: TlpA family protein disulfide reductase [Dehalococcoidia bacterium]|nr:TlpA family protein disulfide reductase [Dehalococcoidia bacterium]MCA9849735.1 TlpA family protein disulfide reductase [Dehalococcoidia bacterium]MCA9855713.1 TlpA family protein disulfide reductase [Dehalococcoidia bacterium]